MSSDRLRLMAVHAHPDDESSKGAATTARYAAEGVEVLVVTCTGGERGDVLNPHYGPAPEGLEAMRAVRREEMAAAAAALGVQQRWLGFVDSGLPEGDPLPPLPEGSFATLPLEEASAPLVAAVREFRPHVITTYDPSGGYPHPDHIMCHRVSVEAFATAGDPERYRGQGEPWTPLKLYYNHGFSLARMRAVHDAIVAAGGESPFSDWIDSRQAREVPEREVTTRIACADHFAQRDAALRAHATQIDPEGWFFAVPREVEVATWPAEEYELAESRVETTLPETDLFAGVRGTEHAR
ncbi:mycothiol conjugate amidase Mca [Cellulomonas xiejunii]|uniref:Mycothiol S-conjugate amidase n=2 Tax=Cellulomonas xiejunii TaxID=2968083 RepID=A0ABY5KSQ6_9CELL|nr:mycothiol conjugate amidase Mca [Cellulomonas xiejunii]MCC2314530.1 mycothiol conjugate amidase Mca [Cellulomonas xiejunii]MCC2322755.1 mycothiol conjugate amidase Mca [Cellulomonas xiejunii]UUI72783.1 mycothiol conjugate amidase Mca [Cellulomonas xiejunii]